MRLIALVAWAAVLASAPNANADTPPAIDAGTPAAAGAATSGATNSSAPTASAPTAPLTGKQVFDRQCVHCHGPSNEAVGTLQLARTRGKDKALLTERNDLTADYVRFVVRHGLKAMPAFVPSDLTDAQLQALTEYLAK